MLFDLNQAIQNKHQGTFGLLEGIPLVPKTLPKFKIQQLILQKNTPWNLDCLCRRERKEQKKKKLLLKESAFHKSTSELTITALLKN